MLLTRTIDASDRAAPRRRSAATCSTRSRETGTAYYNEWRGAGLQIGAAARGWSATIPPRAARRASCAPCSHAAAPSWSRPPRRRRAQPGHGRPQPPLPGGRARAPCPRFARTLEEIAAAERANLVHRMAETQGFVARADRYTDWLGWLAILIGLGAVALAFMAWRAFVEGLAARREAESEGWRAPRPRGGGAGAHPRAFRRQRAAEGRGGRARRRRGAAAPGPEDGGGRPAHRRHRPRFQQHAGGGRRRARSCPAQAARPAPRGRVPPRQCDGGRDPRRRASPAGCSPSPAPSRCCPRRSRRPSWSRTCSS